MRVVKLTHCEGGNCPATYATDRQTVLVQGELVDNGASASVSRLVLRVPQSLQAEHERLGGAPWPDRSFRLDGGDLLVEGQAVRDPEARQLITLGPGEEVVEIGGAA